MPITNLEFHSTYFKERHIAKIGAVNYAKVLEVLKDLDKDDSRSNSELTSISYSYYDSWRVYIHLSTENTIDCNKKDIEILEIIDGLPQYWWVVTIPKTGGVDGLFKCLPYTGTTDQIKRDKENANH